LDIRKYGNLLRFVIVNRIKLIVYGSFGKAKVLVFIAVIFFAVSYGYSVSLLLEKIKPDQILVVKILLGLNLFTFIALSIKNIFPFYKIRKQMISRLFPVSDLVRISIDFFYELISYPHSFFFIFYFMLLLFSPFYNFEEGIHTAVIILLAYSFERISRRIINRGFVFDYPVLQLSFMTCIFIFISGQFFIYQHPNQMSIILIVNSLISIASVLLLWKLESAHQGGISARSIKNKRKIPRNTYKLIYIKNRRVFQALALSLSIKVILLILLSFVIHKENAHPIFLYNFWLGISPITIFTYIHNNTFGFFRELFLCIEIRKNSLQNLFRIYLKLLFIPVSIDLIIFAIFILINGKFSIITIVFYSFSIICLTYSGFQFSLRQGRNVDTGLSYKNTTSMLSTVTSFFIVTSLYITRTHIGYFILCLILLTIILYLGGRNISAAYYKSRYKLIDHLLKGTN